MRLLYRSTDPIVFHLAADGSVPLKAPPSFASARAPRRPRKSKPTAIASDHPIPAPVAGLFGAVGRWMRIGYYWLLSYEERALWLPETAWVCRALARSRRRLDICS